VNRKRSYIIFVDNFLYFCFRQFQNWLTTINEVIAKSSAPHFWNTLPPMSSQVCRDRITHIKHVHVVLTSSAMTVMSLYVSVSLSVGAKRTAKYWLGQEINVKQSKAKQREYEGAGDIASMPGVSVRYGRPWTRLDLMAPNLLTSDIYGRSFSISGVAIFVPPG